MHVYVPAHEMLSGIRSSEGRWDLCRVVVVFVFPFEGGGGGGGSGGGGVQF